VRAYEAAPVAAQILVVQVPDPQRFGVVALDAHGAVERVIEKPTVPPSDLALAGIYVFDARVHDAISTLTPSARGELEITEAIQALIDSGAPVVAHRAEGWWKDTGTVEALLEANRLVLDDLPEDRWVDPSADVTGSTITGPVSIAPGCVVRDCVIEPYTSIGEGSTVIGSTIANSVIMPSCEITGVDRLCDSLLGLGVTVTGDVGSRPHRLTVGDHGRVTLG
jgi:glucose-1-phosphate thymidylyltransferase